ncbi:hypothetical protein QYE76_017982 [Lolium multiflorum]|uniref:DUF4283 domain-containing protein n=1 Tax=Lolium multiflorum TaxID=4521 RepID=A0AAD8PJ11_LOLMU|nr:hypothetical protein QYE76_017982 [Lolium multiflorum]
MVILEQGSLSAYQMEHELTDLVDEDGEWRVKKLNNTDFSMFFPSKESLRMAILGGGLTLISSKLHVIVTTSSEDPAAVEHLSEVWVKLYDVPPPTGRLAPVRLPPHIMIFVKSQGFKVRVLADQGHVGEMFDPPPPPRKAHKDKDDIIEESEEEGWDGRRGNHARKSKVAMNGGTSSTSEPKRISVLLTSSDGPSPSGPKIPATTLSQYGTNLSEGGAIFHVLAKIITQATGPHVPSRETTDSG